MWNNKNALSKRDVNDDIIDGKRCASDKIIQDIRQENDEYMPTETKRDNRTHIKQALYQDATKHKWNGEKSDDSDADIKLNTKTINSNEKIIIIEFERRRKTIDRKGGPRGTPRDVTRTRQYYTHGIKTKYYKKPTRNYSRVRGG